VAETGTNEQLEELARLHEKALDCDDDAQFARLSWELRRRINAYAASPRLLSMFDLLQRTAPRMSRQNVPAMAEATKVANSAIIEAMVARDGPRTEALVRGYVRGALKAVLQLDGAGEYGHVDEAVG
jgi:DNA-binding GntR family transcriptional regulator